MAHETSGPAKRNPKKRMKRLLDWLNKPGWTVFESALVLAGIDPEDDAVATLRKHPDEWNFFPGLERPKDPAQMDAFYAKLITDISARLKLLEPEFFKKRLQ